MSKLKFVAWGHPLHSHSHSYIHAAYRKAFEHMGCESYHFGKPEDVPDGFDFKDTIFLTEGQVEDEIPLEKSSYYITHNSQNGEQYKDLKNITLQVYTHDCMKYDLQKIEDCIYSDGDRGLYMPWATDLLPHECELQWTSRKINPNRGFKPSSGGTISWVGTYSEGSFGNEDDINKFVHRGESHGWTFKHTTPWTDPLSFEENRKVIFEADCAPTIVGKWQHKVGYVPCRLFKNISYGQLGLVNSQVMYDLMEGNVLYDDDGGVLFDKFMNTSEEDAKRMFEASAKIVSERHTYINRINTILDIFGIKL
tara:strand:+ start:73 stop:999 length:927 start_codon:yes stop_codon:yes gene_type:complete